MPRPLCQGGPTLLELERAHGPLGPRKTAPIDDIRREVRSHATREGGSCNMRWFWDAQDKPVVALWPANPNDYTRGWRYCWLRGLSKPRDPLQDPQPGDVLVTHAPSVMLQGKTVAHHLAVTNRTPRTITVLDGPWHDGEGATGGSPFTMALRTWRAYEGRVLVRAEDGLHGWDAIQASWQAAQEGDP